ncbi:MAG: hypothetical protein HQ500_09135 [Flavobacteriales bacterium]|nr:hypothetical protein [Flavobacteriales bacterium]
MKRLAVIAAAAMFSLNVFAQDELSKYDNLQNWRPNDQRGLNVFEDPKTDVEFEGVRVRVGGDFALQFQGLSQTNTAMSYSDDTAGYIGIYGMSPSSLYLDTLTADFNLPTANFNIDAQFADGLRMHLRTYLSARHHAEAWVKGGYLQIDKLDFIKEGLASGLMEMVTIRVGMDEINYGDAHFRRTDNGRAIFNPFVGNYIMDAFTTEAFGEVLFRKSGIIAMAAISNGKLNQSVVNNNKSLAPVVYFKAGYDDQINEDLRIRVTGSGYISSLSYDNGTYLFGGDRGGSRYYKLFSPLGNDFSGRLNPRLKSYNSFQGALFTKFKGAEFFGFYEMVMGDNKDGDVFTDANYTQVGAELIYRFGGMEQFYLGGRYNMVTGSAYAAGTDDAGVDYDAAPVTRISRLNVGGGWFLTKNIMTKVEYVQQGYYGAGWDYSEFQGAEFSGVVVEAAISF